MVKSAGRGSGEARLEVITSYVLIVGVITSLILEIAGIFTYERLYHSLSISNQGPMFLHGDNFFSFTAGIFVKSLYAPNGVHLMTLGIAILILTPYVRGILSIIYFASRKNYKYFFITTFVTVILTISLILH